MIYKPFEERWKELNKSWPNADAIKRARWDAFTKTPLAVVGKTHDDVKAFIKDMEAKHHEEVKAEIKALREAHDAKGRELTQEFRSALASEYLTDKNNPKADMLWAKAWEHGHSSGYHEIEGWYMDMAELIN